MSSAFFGCILLTKPNTGDWSPVLVTTVVTTLGQISHEGSFPLPEAGFPSSGVEIGLQA
jgi:hypothetical protein